MVKFTRYEALNHFITHDYFPTYRGSKVPNDNEDGGVPEHAHDEEDHQDTRNKVLLPAWQVSKVLLGGVGAGVVLLTGVGDGVVHGAHIQTLNRVVVRERGSSWDGS